MIRLKALDQLLPRPDRARISGPTGPEILVIDILNNRSCQLDDLPEYRYDHTQV